MFFVKIKSLSKKVSLVFTISIITMLIVACDAQFDINNQSNSNITSKTQISNINPSLTLVHGLEHEGLHDKYDDIVSAISPNNQLLVTINSGEVKLWNLPQNKLVTTFEVDLNAHPIYATAFSIDSKNLFTASGGGDEGYVDIWDIVNFRDRIRIKTGSKFASNTIPLIVDPNGIAITALLEGRLSDVEYGSWDIKTGQAISVEGKKIYRAAALAISPNQISIFDQEGLILDIKNGKELYHLHLDNDKGRINKAAFSMSNKLIAIAEEDKHNITLWKTNTGEKIAELKGHSADIHSLSFLPNEDLLMSAGYDDSIIIWDTKSLQPIFSTNASQTKGLKSIVLSPDNTLLVSRHNDGSIKVWQVNLQP